MGGKRKLISLFIISPTQSVRELWKLNFASRIPLLNLKMSFPACLINLRYIIVSYSLASFAFFTRYIMQVMTPRSFFLLNYSLRDRTRSVPYSMNLELSQQELHCIIHITRTPDCVDKWRPIYPQTIYALVVNFFFFYYFHLFNTVLILRLLIRPSGIVQLHTGWPL